MATTFDVYPGIANPPRFGEVAALAHRRLSEFAASFGLGAVPKIRYSLHDEGERVTPIGPDTLMFWPRASHVWFEFGGAVGGTDAYCRSLDDDDVRFLEEETEADGPARLLAPHIRKCLVHRRHWWFRRSINQPAIVNLGYGFLAASLAECTGGFINSEDNAWESGRFPCLPGDFYTFYFRPDKCTDANTREWSSRNLMLLGDEGMES